MDKHEKPLSWSGIIPPIPPTAGEKTNDLFREMEDCYKQVSRGLNFTFIFSPEEWKRFKEKYQNTKEVDWEKLKEDIAKYLYEMGDSPHRNEENWDETSWESLSEKVKEYYKKLRAENILLKVRQAMEGRIWN